MGAPVLYLAGPEVFLADAVAVGQAKVALCREHGFTGLFPLDLEKTDTQAGALSTRIFTANLEALRRSDAVIANLTPFRGPSADVGTVFEVAYALASGKPIFAYTNVTGDLRTRVATDCMAIEDFGLVDNLMIVEAIRAQGWNIVVGAAPAERLFSDLTGFVGCLALVTKHACRP